MYFVRKHTYVISFKVTFPWETWDIFSRYCPTFLTSKIYSGAVWRDYMQWPGFPLSLAIECVGFFFFKFITAINFTLNLQILILFKA